MNENIVVKVGADISNLSKNLSAATRDLSTFGNNMKNVGASMATSFGAATLAIGAGLGFAVKKAADFDTEIRKAGAIAGASAKELDALREAALSLGATTSESAGSVAQAMTDMAAKGFTASEVIAAMPGIISAAAASGEDLALAANTVASALNIFGLEASESSRIADILAQSANTSAAGIDDLAYVLQYAGAPAAALGISLEEVAAAAGLMADAGIDGSSAGTSLRQSLLALNNPAKAQAKMMDELGFSMTDSEGKTKSLAQLVGDLTSSMEGMTEAEKVATLAKLVGTEAVSGFLALMNAGPETINKNTKALENSAGASEKAAEKMKAGIGGALENLSGAFETLTITIGDQLVPMVTTLAKFLAGLAEKFANLSDGTMKFLVIGTAVAGIFTAIVAGIGIMLMVVGGAITGLTAIAGAMGIAGGAAGLLSAAFAVLTGPIGLTIAAIVGIIAVLVLAYNKVGWFRDMVNTAWSSIQSATSIAFASIKKVVSTLISATVAFGQSQLAKFKAFWDENGAQIVAGVKFYFTAISAYIKVIMAVIKGIFEQVWPIIYHVVRIALEAIKLVVSNVITLVLGIIQTALKLLKGDWKGAWETIKQTTISMMLGVVKFLSNIDLVRVGKDIMRGLIKGITSMAKGVIGAAKSIADAIPTGIKKILGIASPSRVLAKLGMYTGMGLAQGIDGEVSTVERSAQALANAAIAKPTLSYTTPNTSYGSLSGALSGAVSASVDVSASEESRLLRELIGAVRSGQVITLDGRKVGESVAPHVKTANDRQGGVNRIFEGGVAGV